MTETNDKGRTRAERAGERYYRGIRETPYAPFVKLADRRANITYSCQGHGEANAHMREVYRKELPHFLIFAAAKSNIDMVLKGSTTFIQSLREKSFKTIQIFQIFFI